MNLHYETLNGVPIGFISKEDLPDADLGDKKESYKKVFKAAEKGCHLLHIPCPDIALYSNCLNTTNRCNKNNVINSATFFKNEHAFLKNNIVVMAPPKYNSAFHNLSGYAALMHELRHIWQTTYYPYLNTFHAENLSESLAHPGDIDADAFAIFSLIENYGFAPDHAGEIVCLETKTMNHDAYLARFERIKAIKSELSSFPSLRILKNRILDIREYM